MSDRDVETTATTLYTFPLEMRTPLAFGRERATELTLLRAGVTVRSFNGVEAVGWADVPLNVQWAWPSALSEEERRETLLSCAEEVATAWANFDGWGHPLELYVDFASTAFERSRAAERVPKRARQLILSVLDMATHDAYGMLHGFPVYDTYNPRFMNRDLATLLTGSSYAGEFALRYPADYLTSDPQSRILAWHMVGKEDELEEEELPAAVDGDGYPLSLRGWLRRDGIQAVKIKLGGESREDNVARFFSVWEIARAEGVRLTSIDFNGTLPGLDELQRFLEELEARDPEARKSVCYVEEPCPIEGCSPGPAELANRDFPLLILDESVSTRQELEDAVGRGWRGVALKTCKGQSESLMMLSLAKELGLRFTVQDLTNPMLAQITHLLLGSRSSASLGLESNCMQFYPEASLPEAAVHPKAYRRQDGELSVESVRGPGFGYRLEEIDRPLPEPIFSVRRGEGERRALGGRGEPGQERERAGERRGP